MNLGTPLLNLSLLIGLAVVTAVTGLFLSRLRMLKSGLAVGGLMPLAARYRPMVRLLQDEEFAFARGNRRLVRRMQQQRRQIFRGYVRCLAKDYGQLLTGIRLIMVQSPVDRPELAITLLRSQTSFTLSLCRIELRLWLFVPGLSNVDVSGLLGAVEALRATQAALLSPALAAA